MVNMTWKFPLDNQTFEICSQGKEVIVNGEDIPVQWQGGGWSSDVEHCDLTIGTHNIHIRVVAGYGPKATYKWKRLYVDGLDLEFGLPKPISTQDASRNPFVRSLIFLISFMMGFLFGVLAAVPAIAYLAVCGILYLSYNNYVIEVSSLPQNRIQERLRADGGAESIEMRNVTTIAPPALDAPVGAPVSSTVAEKKDADCSEDSHNPPPAVSYV